MSTLQKSTRAQLERVLSNLNDSLQYMEGAQGLAFEMEEDDARGCHYNIRNPKVALSVYSAAHIRTANFTGSRAIKAWTARDALAALLESSK